MFTLKGFKINIIIFDIQIGNSIKVYKHVIFYQLIPLTFLTQLNIKYTEIYENDSKEIRTKIYFNNISIHFKNYLYLIHITISNSLPSIIIIYISIIHLRLFYIVYYYIQLYSHKFIRFGLIHINIHISISIVKYTILVL